MESCWQETAVVACWQPAAAVEQGHGCTAAAAAVAARIAAAGIVGDGPNSAAVVVDAADPQVGYTPCGALEEHR
jgi:hypothetical protein